MKRFKSQKKHLNLDLKKVKTYVLGSFAGVLAVACIFLTIETSTSGAEIASLQNKQKHLLDRQREIQEEIVQALSVNKLQEQSLTLGFEKATNLVYVADSAPVAKLPY